MFDNKGAEIAIWNPKLTQETTAAVNVGLGLYTVAPTAVQAGGAERLGA